MPLHGPLLSCPLSTAVSLLLYSDHTPLVWAIALLLAGEMSVYFVTHPHTDHNVGYSVALCPPTLLVGLGTPTFHTL